MHLAKMVHLDKKIISAKYYLFTTILTTVTRMVKIAMFECVCATIYSVHCDHHKNETKTFFISHKDLSTVEKSSIKYIVCSEVQ